MFNLGTTMYLKAIEIVGFKSFADKVRLNFEPGVSCIVGPNGCGKSNVIDSVRWAIGEMSWKSLRSSSMVDIIFNGTRKRPPLNMAQVSMVFDNTSHKLPVAFNEVTVSRKIYRSGESEYFLNRVQCRLKDIREMFLDTGIGGEGYAIIDQGSVNQMLEASPEQRREMFEEVAGVSKYKAKREEAVRKLERVDMDIARLSDTLALIAEQIKKLDNEARKARLYQKYREELKSSEIAISLENIKSHDGEIQAAAAQLEPVLKEIEDKKNSVSALEGSVAALNLNLTHKQNELSQFSEKIAAAKYQIGLLEGAIQNCINLCGEFTLQVQNSKAEETTVLARLAQLTPALADLKNKIKLAQDTYQPLQEQYNKKYAEVNANEAALKQAQILVEKAAAQVAEISQKQLELSGKIALEESAFSHEQNNLIALERSLQTQNERAENLKKEVKQINNSLKEKENSLSQIKQNQSKAENTLSALNEKRTTLNEQINALNAKRASLNAKMQMIQSQGKNDPYWVGTKLVEESAIKGIKGTLRKYLKFDEADSLTVEETFGKFLDSVLCDNFEAAKKAIALLKQKGKARCRFIILPSVPAFIKGESLLKNAKSLTDFIEYPPELEGLVKYIACSYCADGGEIADGFWLSGGAEGVKSPEAYWGEEAAAKKELKEVSSKQEELNKGLSGLNGQIRTAEEEIKILRIKFQEESIAANSLKNDINLHQRGLNEIMQACSQIINNKQEVAEKIESRKQKSSAMKAELEKMGSSYAQAKNVAEQARKQREGLQNKEETLKAEIEQANAKLYEAKIKKNNLELDFKTALTEETSLKEAQVKRGENIIKANERIKTLDAEKLSSQAKLSAQRDTLAALEVAENKMQGDLNALKTDFEEKNTKLNSYKTSINELTLKAHDLENALTNHRRQKTAIINNLLESWNITQQEAQMKWGGIKVDYERVKMMRKRIENMGAVNMTAPEEYDALTQRDTFLKKQIEDLSCAKRDLKAAISKINATTRDNFKYTFEQVRSHFKNIYQSLFVGGEAELILTSPENLLETGIEITVQPPGKKVLNISALSGGEKALTVVSLLFAFFTHNPSPFCILDEADAPLDEANVERFTNLIKEYAKKTQFIVVTHNKRTMEAAQMLYGVTMEENGVSKVLSLNLKDQDAKTKNLVEAASK